MDVWVDLHLEGRGSCSGNPLMYPVGNISIVLKRRFQKVYRNPSNGQQLVLRDHTQSPSRFPVIQFPPNALTSPMYLFRALSSLNLDHMLCVFLHQQIASGALYLSSGGLAGFHLSADVEVVEIEVVEADGAADEIERSMRKETSRFVVEMLSRKQRRVLDLDFNKAVKEGDNCAVCLDALIEKEEIKGKTQLITMPCDHIFHASCISRWLEEQNSCPMCRREIQYEDLVG